MTLFLDEKKLEEQQKQVEACEIALNTGTTEIDEKIHMRTLLAVVRVGKEEHKKLHKIELKAALILGRQLISKKKSLKHGQYTPYLQEFGITTQDASRYCAVADKWPEIVSKGYTDYSISTVLHKLREDAINAQDGDLLNAEKKRWEDTASEAAGREAHLMLELNQAVSNLEQQRQENESLRARLNEFLVSCSQPGKPSPLEAVYFPCSFYDEEILSYLR
jgi:hypothetical protein